MNGCLSRSQTQIGDTLAVTLHVARTITGSEHITILADCRTDIILAEFNKHIRLYSTESIIHLFHEHIHSLRHCLYVTASIVIGPRRIIRCCKAIDKIEFETIKSVITHRVLISLANPFTHLRKTRVKTSFLIVFPQIFSLETLIIPTVFTDKRH